MKKVGTLTTAIGLVTLGLALFAGQFYPDIQWLKQPLQWWPLVLIGLGVELIVWRAAKPDEAPKLDGLVIVFFIGILLAGGWSLSRQLIDETGMMGWKYHERKIDRQQESAQGVTNLDIDLSAGQVTVLPAADQTVRAQAEITYHTNRRYRYPTSYVTMHREGSRIFLTENPKLVRSRFEQTDTAITIYLPAGIKTHFSLDSGDLSIRGTKNPLYLTCGSGSVQLTDLSGPVIFRGDSGDVKASGIRGDLDVQLVSGSLTLDGIEGRVRTQTESGDTSLTNLSGSISVASQTGSVRLSNSQNLTDGCSITAENGDIRFEAARLNNCSISAVTETGGITIAPGLAARGGIKPGTANPNRVAAEGADPAKQTLRLGTGRIPVQLSCETGSITIR
ncbi:MAG: DUF4097 family beta strand repeat-containing protein [Solirubrobacterales bacterium]